MYEPSVQVRLRQSLWQGHAATPQQGARGSGDALDLSTKVFPGRELVRGTACPVVRVRGSTWPRQLLMVFSFNPLFFFFTFPVSFLPFFFL